jgi:hypothetical protein
MKQHQTAEEFLLDMKKQKRLKNFLRDNTSVAVEHLNLLADGDESMQAQLTEALCLPDCVFFLVKYGQIDAVWSMISQISNSEMQLTVLTAPEIVFILSMHGKVQPLREKIKGFSDPKHQLSIYTVPYAVFGLTKYGNPESVLDLLQALPIPHQVAVLSTAQVIYGLADNLDENGINRLLIMLESYGEQQQVSILASYMAVFGLVKNGKVSAVLSLLKGLSQAQQDQVRNAPYVVFVLIENAPHEELEFFIGDLPEKRFERSKQSLLSQYRLTQKHLH